MRAEARQLVHRYNPSSKLKADLPLGRSAFFCSWVQIFGRDSKTQVILAFPPLRGGKTSRLWLTTPSFLPGDYESSPLEKEITARGIHLGSRVCLGRYYGYRPR